MPLIGARLEIQRDDRSGEEVVAAALGAVSVRGAIAHGHVNHSKIAIDGRLRPDRPTAVRPRITFPSVVARLARTGDRPETPILLPRICVEGTEETTAAALAAGHTNVHTS